MTGNKPRLLDLFCCAGGAAKGYQRAGFYVVGVDIKPQPHYCGDEFHQADALTYPLDGFDAYHASPPCQDYSKATKHLTGKNVYPRLISHVLERFKGKSYIIENVFGSDIPIQNTLEGVNGLMLCGTMLGLSQVRRHRYFLSSFPIPRPFNDCAHKYKTVLNPYNTKSRHRDGLQHGAAKAYGAAMGVDWMHGMNEIGEAIPPAYTEYIGKHLMVEVLSKLEPTSSPSNAEICRLPYKTRGV